MGKKFIVISDLHVGTGKLDGFDPELEMTFLDFLGSKKDSPEPIELIINGDFFEFIQAEPYIVTEPESSSIGGTPLCHTEKTSTRKMANIIATHPKLFDGLADFLSSRKENRILILPGNHDVDLFWEEIQNVLRTRIAGSDGACQDRLVFMLDSHYSPSEMPGLWIAHGHMYDPANRFIVNGRYRWGRLKQPILTDHKGNERIIECPGTKLLLRYLNKIMENDDYHNIKYIKPVYLFLFWGASLFNKGEGPAKFRASVAQMYNQLLKISGFSPSEVLHTQGPLSTVDIIRDIANRLTYCGEIDLLKRIDVNQSFKSYIKNQANAEALLEKLARDPSLLDGIELVVPGSYASLTKAGLKEMLTLPNWMSQFFKMSNEDMLTIHAKDLVSTGKARYVVMGHTHEVIEDHKTGYYNPGCLTRRFFMEYNSEVAKWDYLRREQLARFPYCLHYVEADPSADPPVKLNTIKPR